DLGERRQWRAMPPTFDLEEIEGHRREDRVMVPPRVAAALEVVEPQLGFEIAILDFDRPAAPREAYQCLERRRRWQAAEVVLPLAVLSENVIDATAPNRREWSASAALVLEELNR